MKKLITELQKLLSEHNYNILENKISEGYLEISSYIKKN